MDRKKGAAGRNRNVFKGSVLVSLLVESHPKRFPSRAVACKLARRLYRDGQIRSIFGAKEFEDSAQLYVWEDDDVSKRGHGRNMTSPTSSSCSNPPNVPSHTSSSHKQADWQLIQDIREKVLNRSEAYNIVTSYNTFFQELEEDFGFDHSTHSPRKSGGSDIGWSGSTSNTPYTSTLELKKDTIYSTDSSADYQAYYGRFKDGGHKHSSKKHLKRSSLSPYSKSSSSKDTSPHLSQETSPQLNHHQRHQQPQSQTTKQLQHQSHQHHHHHHHPHHHQQQQQQHLQSNPKMNSNSQSTGVVDAHPDRAMISEERLQNGGTVLNTEPPSSSHPEPNAMDYEIGSNQPGTVSSQVSSIAAESTENSTPTNLGGTNMAVNGRGQKSTQDPSYLIHQSAVPPEVQKWLDPRSVIAGGNSQWDNENLKSRKDDHGVERANRSRWPDTMVSEGVDSGRRWPESANSYSDNEKQLLEEMRRMKKEHQNVLRTYEGRINKLMAKMHELRNIAEMLENSSSKSSPYGVLPGKLALLNILGEKDLVDEKKLTQVSVGSETDQAPPPLPPRPGRGSRVYPNKPIIHTSVSMRPLPWSRIILEESNGKTEGETSNSVWQGMVEPKIETDELERLFSGNPEYLSDVNLYEDICLRRGRSKSQLVSVYDGERSQRIVSELRALRCTLPDVIQAFVTLNSDHLHTDSFAELLELLSSQRELDKIFHQVKRKGGGQLEAPEYLVFELSKVDHFRERLEFLRFKNKLQINLFEIDQQLRELHTACEEITSSLSLKHVLETVLAVGNHMNAGTERGQADGFRVDVLLTLKDIQDPSKQMNLLELIMRIYCLKFESDLELGCPTRFRLPEPSNMRHAAQVSFEDIQRALKELREELSYVRNKLEALSKREGNTLTIALRVTSENFMTSAVEVLAEEQKLLDDTKVQFWKTATFFSLDGQKSTPHEFFQIWATFLHDCKYYWKLAHRNLAKAKFNSDLVTKSQLSSSSLPGFNNLKSVMMKHVASFQQDAEMRVSKAQQLQHINSWIESVGKYAMEMQPEGVGSNLETNDHADYHSRPSQVSQRQKGQQQIHAQQPQQQKQQHHHQHQSEQPSSPPYENQPVVSQFQKKDNLTRGSHQERQLEKESKSAHSSNRSAHPASHRFDDVERPVAPPSPKMFNTTPPNVIKPQPIAHTSPTVSSPSPTVPNLQLIQPLSLVPYQPEPPLDTNNNKQRKNDYGFHDDNFGFEPLYESLSRHAQSQQGRDDSENTPSYSDDMMNIPSPSGPLSPDSDSAQKKNAKFFKSLLKRDQKRPADQEQTPQGTQHSALKSVSAPFNKLRNTVVQKLSGNTNPKKSSPDQPPKVYGSLDQALSIDTPQRPIRGMPAERDHMSPHEFPRDSGNFFREEERGKDPVNYQNYYYPGQPRRPEGQGFAHKPHDQEGPPGYPGKTFHREGHDSVPSTISSMQSYHGVSRYQGNLLQPRDGPIEHLPATDRDSQREDVDVDQNTKRFHSDNLDGGDSGGSARHSGKARVRAPIALGSNISISDVYGKSSENSFGQNNESAKPSGIDDPQDRGSSNNIAARPSSSEPKWVKANPVPVYKAKLIPNYENQSKYDPRLEGGVRGQAEAAVPAKHAPQVSISSDVYRQELQKKSEQYVGGGIYPSPGQNLRGNAPLGVPTSYTVLPPKPTHYHASPVIIGHNTHGVSSTAENASNFYPLSGNLLPDMTPVKGHGRTHKAQSNRESDEPASSSDYSPPQPRQADVGQPNFTISPDGRLELTQGYVGHSASAERDKKQNKDALPARRSSSAHNILDRDFERVDRTSHSAHASPGDPQMKTQSRVSRRDVGEKKTTPTSHRDHSQGRSRAPQTVSSLIDRFEKKPDGSHLNVGLLDIDDKPPSMTSTPVTRRKNQHAVSSPPDSSGRSSGPRSDGESSRSHSEASKKSFSRQETPDRSGHHKGTVSSKEAGGSHPSQYHHSSKSPHQAVAPFSVQPLQSGPDVNQQSQHQIYQASSQYPGDTRHSDRYQQNPSYHSHNQQHVNADHQQYDAYAPSNNQSGPPIRHTNSDRVPNQISSDRNQRQTPSDRGPGRTPSEQIRSDHGRSSSSSRRSHHSSHSQGPTKGNLATPPASSSSSLQSGNYQSAFLPKPEPQYPNPSSTPDSSASNQPHQHPNHPYGHHHQQQHHEQHPQQHQLNSHSAMVQPQRSHQYSMSTNYGVPPQQSQQRPSPQICYTSPFSSQHQQSSYTNNNMNVNTSATTPSDGRDVNGNPEHSKYIEDMHRAPKSTTSSAFDRPLKAGTSHGRQPGAMAVVKPTVMNL